MAKVLVAEDEQDIRELLVDILVDAGYDVTAAEDGGVALELALREQPDVILLDVWMPVMDGFEVLGRLRENPTTKGIPVVIVTAMPPAEGERQALEMGVEHFISKPFEADIVHAAVSVAVREGGSMPIEDEDGDSPTVWRGAGGHKMAPSLCSPRKLIGTAEKLIPLEKQLGGGIPLGSLTLVEGASASGKSVLCQHLTYGALVRGLGVTYFTSEHTPRGLITQMGSLDLPVSDYIRTDTLRVNPLQEPSAEDNPEQLLSSLASELGHLAEESDVIVVDSISNLATYSEDKAILGFFSSCKRLCTEGTAVILVAHSAAFEESLLRRLRFLCEAHLSLRPEKIGQKLANTVSVCKAQGAELGADNLISFEVEPDIGMRLLPMGRVRA